jgi:hypothetical protein
VGRDLLEKQPLRLVTGVHRSCTSQRSEGECRTTDCSWANWHENLLVIERVIRDRDCKLRIECKRCTKID